jgi:chromosome segregation ATPase
MRQSARVLSTDAIAEFQSALAKYTTKAREALRTALLDIRHTFDWLERQQPLWQREADKRHEEVLRCRNELALARSAPEGWRNAVSEREIELRKAQMRLREAEEKVAAIRRWRRALPQAINEYELPMRRLGGFLDGDIQHALIVLDAKIEALKQYMALTAPEGAAAPPAAPATASGEKP